MTAADLIYFAGLFDGEGWVVVSKAQRATRTAAGATPLVSHQLVVGITMTDGELLDTLALHFGGSVRKVRRREAHHRQAFDWRLSTRQALDFLAAVEPWLRTKRELARTALRFLPLLGTCGRRPSFELLVERERVRNAILKLNNPDVPADWADPDAANDAARTAPSSDASSTESTC